MTPLNDSFVDFDLLGDVDPQTMEVARPSFYSELVWECRKRKAQASAPPDRLGGDAQPHVAAGCAQQAACRRGARKAVPPVGFRLSPGLSERVIYRELFPMGLSLLDLHDVRPSAMTMSHVAARQEIRDILIVLKLPGLEGKEIAF